MSCTNIQEQPAEEAEIKISSKDKTFSDTAITLISIIYNTKEFYDAIKKPNFFHNSKI